MGIADMIAEMRAAGASLDLIEIAVRAVESSVDAERAKAEPPKFVRRLDVPEREWQALRAIVFKRDSFTCAYCSEDVQDDPQCDHVVPLVAGGRSVLSNLTTACRSCNSSKGASERPKGTQ